MNAPGPLCGKPMRRVEKPGRPVFEDPACGRREDHPGPCRSEASLARTARYESERWAARGNRQRQVRRRTLRLHENLSAVITAAEQVARTRALTPARDSARRAA